MTDLPSYPLSLQKAKTSEDAAAHVLVHNINSEELVEYINQLKLYIEESLSTETQGITSAQARTIVENSKYEINIPISWPTSTININGDASLGTMTRTNNADGSVTITITNIKNTKKLIAQVQTLSGVVVNPKITITKSFIILHFNRRNDVDATPGYGDNSTDPNIKKLIIF